MTIFALALGLWSAGCADAEVRVQLRFPSEETFLRSHNVQVDVYDGAGDGAQSGEAVCRALALDVAQAPAGLSPLKASGPIPACVAYDGALRFEELAVGRRVFFALATAPDGTLMLSGCAVADVYPPTDGKDAAVTVQLATLPTYSDAAPLSCADVNDKCRDRKPCVE